MNMTIEDFKKLNVPVHFGATVDGEMSDAMNFVGEQLKEVETVNWGASKYVIFPCKKDYVVKIPFNGEFSYWYDTKKDEEMTDFIKREIDYCSIEASIYADAVVSGLDEFFAKTKYYGVTFNGTPFYISEKVIEFYAGKEKSKNPSNESKQKAIKYIVNDLNQDWIARAIEWYGEYKVKELIIFLVEEGVNDLHSNNLGFRKNGAPVILDYSGFSS